MITKDRAPGNGVDSRLWRRGHRHQIRSRPHPWAYRKRRRWKSNVTSACGLLQRRSNNNRIPLLVYILDTQMIVLDYFLDEVQPSSHKLENPDALEAFHFSHLLFFGTISFKIDECDFSTTKWDHVTILHFADWASRSVRHLDRFEPTSIRFTETIDSIDLTRIGEYIEVTSTYSSCRAKCPYLEFRNAVTNLSARLIEEIIARYSGLSSSQEFLRVRKRVLFEE